MASDKMKMSYDICSNSVGFEEGDQVWLYNLKHCCGHSLKLQANWEGPYTVEKRFNNVQYTFKVIHLDHLAKYHSRDGLLVSDEHA